MKSRIALALMLAALCSGAAAQNSSVEYTSGGMHMKGGQAISLNAGVQVPLFVLPASAGATDPYPLGVGTSFGLSYQYFVADRISVGGSFTGAFNGTVGGRSLFMAPIAFKASYWWGASPMEYSASIDAGAAILRLSGNGMITPFAKAGMGAYYQVNGSWSLGGQAFWWFIPEIHTGSYANLTRYANIAEISAGAIYHL